MTFDDIVAQLCLIWSRALNLINVIIVKHLQLNIDNLPWMFAVKPDPSVRWHNERKAFIEPSVFTVAV